MYHIDTNSEDYHNYYAWTITATPTSTPPPPHQLQEKPTGAADGIVAIINTVTLKYNDIV